MLPTIEMPNYFSLDTLSYCMGIFPWENHVKSFMNGKYILLIYEKIGGCLGHLPNLRHWWWYIKMHIESEWMWPKRRPLIFLPTYICSYLRYTNGIFLMGFMNLIQLRRHKKFALKSFWVTIVLLCVFSPIWKWTSILCSAW